MSNLPNVYAGPLGQSTQYRDGYDASHLHPMTRLEGRRAVGLSDAPAMLGEDEWNAYEFSWLNPRGKPEVAQLRIAVPADSPRIIESKSMKLYLNGFSQTSFASPQSVQQTLQQDLSGGFGCTVVVELKPADAMSGAVQLFGHCLDSLDVQIEVYDYQPNFLVCLDGQTQNAQSHYTHLFRSLCPVTGQPDWASVVIEYQGTEIDPVGLLRYLVSYRNHQAFHETTIERIYADIWQRCMPDRLSVHGRFLRRGGIDINPYRSSHKNATAPIRVPRQ